MLKVFSVKFKLKQHPYPKFTEVDGNVWNDVVKTLIHLYGTELEYIEDIVELEDEPIPF